MAPRRARKVVKVMRNNVYSNLQLSEVMCPICRTILIEPVSLPCNHDFCLSCFESTMAKANLVCPLCRIRVGSWLRKAKKEKSLINNEFWKAIRAQFPEQILNKLSGIDETFEEKAPIKIASPGEIHKEYEIQKEKEEVELKKQREIEAKASEELIRKITEEDEHEKRIIDEKIKFDQEVAKQIAKNICSEAGPSNVTVTKPPKKQVPLDRFLKSGEKTGFFTNVDYLSKNFTTKVLCQTGKKLTTEKGALKQHLQIQRIVSDAEVSDGSDSIESECRYFKPIDYKSVPPVKAIPPIKIPTRMGNAASVIIGAPQGIVKFTHNNLKSAFTAIRCSSSEDNEPQINPKEYKTNKIPAAKGKRRNGSINTESVGRGRVSKRPSIRSDEVISKEVPPNKKTKLVADQPSSSVLNSKETLPKQKNIRLVPLLQRRTSKLARQNSPPFYGFDSKESKCANRLEDVIQKGVSANDCKVANTVISNKWESEALKKKLQEAADLEFAKKLQAELNSDGYGRYSTRQGYGRNRRNLNRQVTLDEIVKSHCKVSL